MQHISDLKSQLHLLRGGRLVDRVAEPVEKVEDDPQERFLTNDPKLPNCDYCHQPHGGTQHGWVKLANHGPQTQWKTQFEPCPKCSPDAKRAQQEEKAKKSQSVLANIFGDAQIPFHAKKWEFANYPASADQEAYKVVYEFVQQHLAGDEDARRGLYLGGDTGRCKTSLAISALKEIMKVSNQSGLFVMTMELMERLRASYQKGQPGAVTHDELIQAVCSVTWLVLDDLAVEKPTPYVLEKLYYIIEKRRSAGLYTIITSNLSTKQLESYWRPDGIKAGEFHPGVRVVERIREYCAGVGVRGKNMREANW
jgi:DNA replication protein DnaC